MIIITHKRTNAQGITVELKDDRNIIYTRQQIIKKLKEGTPIGIHSKKLITVEDIYEDNLVLPAFYYRDQGLRSCQYL